MANTEDREQYIISSDAAYNSYNIDKNLTSSFFQEFESNNYIIAIKSYADFNFTFHRNGTMIVEKYDYLAMKIDTDSIKNGKIKIVNEQEIYRIEKDYFKSHYEQVFL